MSKNQQSVSWAVVNAVLVLFATQMAQGVYPLPDPWLSVSQGLVALLVAGVTAASPFFDWRSATRR